MRTLQEIKDCEKEILTPEDVARVLGCKAYNINLQAKKKTRKSSAFRSWSSAPG